MRTNKNMNKEKFYTSKRVIKSLDYNVFCIFENKKDHYLIVDYALRITILTQENTITTYN